MTIPPTPSVDKRTTTILMACLGVFVAYMPVTSVAVSLPAIAADLGASTSQLSWVQDAFVLPMAAFILTAGLFGDVYGRRRVFLTGLGLAAVGSAVALTAHSVQILWVGQAISGLAAAALLPTTLALISHAVPDVRARGRFIAMWATSLMLSLATGPLIAGVIVESAGWRWIYALPIVVALIAVVVAAPTLPESKSPHVRRLDWPGQITAALAISALVYGVIEGGAQDFTEPAVIAAFVIAVVSAVTFIVVEQRSDSPMLDLALFRSRAFTATTVIAMVTFLALIGFFFVLSLYFGLVQRLDTLDAAWRLVLMSGTSLIAGPIAGAIMHRVSSRVLITVGLLMVSAAQFSLVTLAVDTSFASISWRLVLLGFGMGLVMTPMTATAVSSVPFHLAGMAAAGNNAFRQVGGALGPAVLGTLLTAGAVRALPDRLASNGVGGPLADSVVAAVDSEGLGAAAHVQAGPATGAVMTAFGDAFLAGLQLCLVVSGTLTALAAVVAAVMLRPRADVTPEPVATHEADPALAT